MSLITSECNPVHDWTIEYDDLNDRSYDVDMDDQTITIHNFGLSDARLMESQYFRVQADLALIEAQSIATRLKWLGASLHDYHPEMIMILGRIMMADAQVQKIAYAYHEKCEGRDRMWKHLLCSDVMDLAKIYDQSLSYFQNNQQDDEVIIRHAMASVFHSWFLDHQRIETCDYDTLSFMDDMLDDDVVFGSQKPTLNDVTCLTPNMQDERSYLDRELQKDILKNPFYHDVKNDIHKTYLTQIITDNGKMFVNGIGFSDFGLAQRFFVMDN